MNLTRRSFVIAIGGVLVASNGLAKTMKINDLRYGMIHDETKCIGCNACVVACRQVNKVPEGVTRLSIIRSKPIGQYPNIKYQFYRHSCNHCENAPCIDVCPTGASFIDKTTGIVDVNSDRCVGCLYCVAACPYHVRFIHPIRKSADKCNFCRDTNLASGKLPACVGACPNNALTFGNLDDPNSDISELLRSRTVYRAKVHLGTSPKLYHIPFSKGVIL